MERSYHGIKLPVEDVLSAAYDGDDHHQRVRLADGRIAFVADFGGVWCAFAAAEAQDAGGNVYARRTPGESLEGALCAVPRALRTVPLRYVGPIAWLS